MPRFEIFFGTLGTGTAIFGGVSLATVGSVVGVAGGIFGLGYAIYWLNKACDGCGLDQGREMDGISGADNHGVGGMGGSSADLGPPSSSPPLQVGPHGRERGDRM